jgi:Outer membrane protein beta-barrel domain
MYTTRTIRLLIAVLTLACASAASAQQKPSTQSTMPLDGQLFVNVNVGAQTQSHTANNDFSFPIYGQTATVTTTASVDGGAFFDLSVGYRATPKFGAAIGYSGFSSTGSAQGAGSVPSPTFFNRPATVTINPIDAKRRDRNFYLLAVGFVPVTDKVEVSVFVGPSFTRVQQEFIVDGSVPAGTQSLTTTIQNQTGTAKGINIGADATYQFLNQIGAGVFIRYNGGSVDLPSLKEVKVGGLQLGIGVRLRF